MNTTMKWLNNRAFFIFDVIFKWNNRLSNRKKGWDIIWEIKFKILSFRIAFVLEIK